MTTLPMSPVSAMKTRDLEEAASYLREAAVPYVSELLPGSPPFSTQIFLNRGTATRVSRVTTTGLLRVEALLPPDSYALVLDLGRGVGHHQVEQHGVFVGPEFGLVQSPLQPVEIRTTSNYDVLFVRISRQAVLEQLQKLLGQEPRKDLRFHPVLRMATQAGRRVRELCDNLRRRLSLGNQQDAAASMQTREMEGALITLLLQAQSHNYKRLLNRGSEAGSWQLNAAEEFMRSNAHLPLALGDVCQASGVNARTLQHSFRRRRGRSPMEFLREIRMEQVRSSLRSPDERTSVSGEAAQWGFFHFGRFSQEYRKRFGELPSETLRAARRRSVAAENMQ